LGAGEEVGLEVNWDSYVHGYVSSPECGTESLFIDG